MNNELRPITNVGNIVIDVVPQRAKVESFIVEQTVDLKKLRIGDVLKWGNDKVTVRDIQSRGNFHCISFERK